MIPYIVLLLIPLLFCFVDIRKTNDGIMNSKLICIGHNEEIKTHNIGLPVFFLILYIMLSLRSKYVGTDMLNYESIFMQIGRLEWKTVFSYNIELLFAVINWLIFNICDSFQLYIAIIAFITILPIATIYCEDRRNSYLKLVIFLNMSTFVMLFSGIRQGIAMGLGMIAYKFVREKKLSRFIIIVIIAIFIHKSAFMLIFMYPLYYISFKKKHLCFIIPAIIISLVFNKQLFKLGAVFLQNIYEEQIEEITATGAFGSLALFAIFLIFSYVIPDETRADKDFLGLRNFLTVAVILQCFAPIHNLAMRMNYYYILFVPLAVAKTISIPRERYKQLAEIANYVISITFTAIFIGSIYVAYKTGESALDTVPYITFWQK